MPVCASCGAENPDGFRFCGACGEPLAAAAPARESRKTVTILFCDVAGFTPLGERLDPESLRRVMRRYFAEIQAVIERHGGTVEKFIGDAAMAVFGLPRVNEDDALRAVRAAAEIRERLPGVATEVGVELTFRTGVNTGPVVVGAGNALVVGDAVNVAARLEQAAPLGEILIGADTWRLVRDAVEVEAVERLELKGKSLPVAAYRLLRVDPDAPAQARHLDTPLVGRRRELGLLHNAFERAVGERACHLFTLLGPAGIGKSRLAAAWLESLDGATVVRGRCLHYGDGITFFPLVEALMQLGEPAAEALEHVSSGGVASSQELFLEVRRLFERVAAEQPLVVVFDDLQWAQPMLLDLLDHVADLSRSAPIVLACLARPDLLDERPAWAGGKLNATTALLEPLTADECAQLLHHLAPDLDAAVAERIVEASEGNPFFLEETLAFVSEGGDDARVPPTIQALLAARLEQLREDVRAVAERGAVEGKVFHRGAVLELAPEAQRTDLDRHLVALVRKELIRPDVATLPGEDAFRFRNLLIRDAAYDALPKETRAGLHERFADWVERVAPDLVELDEIAGWHLEQSVRYRHELGLEVRAEVAMRAARHLAAAGRRAVARTDLRAAETLLTRARELTPPGDRERARLALDLVELLIHMGTDARIEALLEEALADPATRSHAAIARLDWLARIQPVEFPREAAATLPDAISEFRRAGDERGLARAQLVQFTVHWMASEAGLARTAAQAAAEHAARAGDRALLSQAVGSLVGPLVYGPDDPATVAKSLERLEAWDAGPFAASLIELAWADLDRIAGRLDAARTRMRRSDDIMRELGFEVLRAANAQATAPIELDAGDPAEAVRQLRASWARSQELGDTGFGSTTAAMLARALVIAGELVEAERVALVAMEDSAPQDVINFVYGKAVLARVHAERGELEQAEQLARAAIEDAFRTDFAIVRAEALHALADVLAASRRPKEAAEVLAQAIVLYEQKGETRAAERARELAAELATARP